MSDTGGPAFPVVIDMGLTVDWSKGMTLRDYFAAKAMQVGGPANKPPAYDNETRAKYAYEMADAMLKARNQ
jgi:hypothetical protein